MAESGPFDRRYIACEEVSRGGMGRVVLVRDERIGREVALKEILPELALAKTDTHSKGSSAHAFVRRFAREATITGQLEHPSIVPVYEVGQKSDGTPYYTMRYVRGRTLGERLKECDGLTERMRVLPNFLSACNGAAYAHSKSIVHRDLKPTNILVGEFGETVIIDWGLAKIIGSSGFGSPTGGQQESEQSDPEVTGHGEALGSPYYMAPEQVQAHQVVDFRTDVYALGVILYEILTGRRPFEGTDRAILFEEIRDVQPTNPSALERHIPRDLETICLKALNKNPDDRYQSAKELADDVERFQTGALVYAYSYSAWDRVRRFYTVHRAAVNVTAAAVLVVAIIAIGAVVRIREARDNAIAAQKLERVARQSAEEERYLALVSLARHEIDIEQIDAARATLLAIKPAQREWEWDHLFAICSQGKPVLKGPTIGQISMDGSRWAGVGPRQPLATWRLPDFSLQRPVAAGSSRVSAIAFLPQSGSLLAGHVDGSVGLWNDREEKPLTVIKAGSSEVTAIVPAIDDHSVAIATNSGEIAVFNLADQSKPTATLRAEILHTFSNLPNSSGDVSLATTPDGRVVAAALRPWTSAEGALTAWDLAAGTSPIISMTGWRPQVSADGRTFVCIQNGRVIFHGIDNLSATSRTVEMRDPVLDIAISEGGDWVAALTDNGEVFGWRISALDQPPMRLAKSGGGLTEQRLISVGPFFATLSQEGPFRLIDPTRPNVPVEVRGHSGMVRRVSFDRVQNRLISTGNDEIVRSWDLNLPAPIQTIYSRQSWFNSVKYDAVSGAFLVAGVGLPLLSFDARTLRERTLHPSLGPGSASCLAISPDRRFIATTSDPIHARVVAVETGSSSTDLIGHQNNVCAIEFSPDGTRVLTGSWDGTARVWDRETGQELQRLDRGKATVYVAHWFDPRTIVTGTSLGELTLWNAETGFELASVVGHSGAILALREVIDGVHFLTGTDDGSIKLWNKKNLADVATLSAGGSAVRCLAQTPDGRRFLSGHENGSVRIWDAALYREIVTLSGHSAAVRDLAFLGDGRTLVSAAEDGDVRVWQAPPVQYDNLVGP